MNDIASDDDFRRFYQTEPSAPPQCEVRSIDGRCTNEGEFHFEWDEKDGWVCRACLPTRLRQLVPYGPVVVIEHRRVKSYVQVVTGE